MCDDIIKIGYSTVQHGKHNNRIFLMNLSGKDFPDIIDTLEKLAIKNKYTKICAKVPAYAKHTFEENDYKVEADIPGLFSDKMDGYFMSKYFSERRKCIENNEMISDILDVASSKEQMVDNIPELTEGFSFNVCYPRDTVKIINFYKAVFKTYPFPIFNYDYVLNTMLDNIDYYGIWNKEKIISLAASEVYMADLNAEISGIATLADYRGNNYSLYILSKIEEKMKKLGIKTLYSISIASTYSISCILPRWDIQWPAY